MQQTNWNDLRYLLAISRGRTLKAAARLLGVDDTTVSRRLAVLQDQMGARLCQRLDDGTLRLTAAGERVAMHAERIEHEIGLCDAALSGARDPAAGTVRLTSVPIIVNRILVPGVPVLLSLHPALQLEIIAEPRDLNLTRREADLALRLARPRTGGTKVTARRVGLLHYDIYAAASCSPQTARSLPWITYDETMGHLPQARFMAADAGTSVAPVRVNDTEAVYAAVTAGLGRSLLPRVIADSDPRLRRVTPGPQPAAVTRELWLLVHRELRTLSRIEAVARWIEDIMPR